VEGEAAGSSQNPEATFYHGLASPSNRRTRLIGFSSGAGNYGFSMVEKDFHGILRINSRPEINPAKNK